jgi:hypothetical protein
MNLYTMTTIVREYRGCKDVPYHWCLVDPSAGPPRPHPELIAGYKPDDPAAAYAKEAIEELFTEEQTAQLKAYLDGVHGGDGITTIAEAETPIPGNSIGCGALPVGGLTDFYMLDREPLYSLPFRAWAYFDLRHCDPAVIASPSMAAPPEAP